MFRISMRASASTASCLRGKTATAQLLRVDRRLQKVAEKPENWSEVFGPASSTLFYRVATKYVPGSEKPGSRDLTVFVEARSPIDAVALDVQGPHRLVHLRKSMLGP